ncbi:DUF4179 domain-containing protein [Bacillus sp. NEB1478]|uniref:DUF4179 domain-containing protein n=1 Tax=Bacillus sp. NEB1478 TaxID=3073816 RepID=UPI002872D549|nr:DUF4179 domain-containing protein [Bacillus sp. NEB1478]WNB91698.1 DUF4179 domain-containing protein [Bacillus sp. NEB1478]
MDKEQFNKQYHDELPREEIFQAIRNGMEEGRRIKRKRKMNSGLRLSAWATGTAASVVLASGFMFSPIQTVLADVPLIGSLYEKVNFKIGKDLAASHLVTEINQNATSNGVDVTLTSAYYDGVMIGVTFKAEGKDLSLEKMDKENSPEAGYTLGGEDSKQLGGTIGDLKKMEDGSYVAAIEFQMRDRELPKDFTLPLTFTSMANKKGVWRFDVPVRQLPVEKIMSDAKGFTKDRKHGILIHSVTKGKATALLDFTSVHPLEGKGDSVDLKVMDDRGRRISVSGSSVFKVEKAEGHVEKETRYQIDKINSDAKYLIIYPEVNQGEKDAIAPLNKTVPFEMNSRRFDYRMVVGKVEKKNEEVVVDYQIQNVKTRKDFLMNFADMITLVRTEDVVEGEDMQAQYDALKRDSLILGNKGKLVDEDTLRFQSTFKIDGVKDFNLNDYSLMVPFEIFSLNDEIPIDPIKVELK